CIYIFFFIIATETAAIYTHSLHDALPIFMQAVQNDPNQFYPNTDEGREAYIRDSVAFIDQIRAKLPEYFGMLPKADMIVKRVEPDRKSTRLNSSHVKISYAVFCLKKKSTT